MAKDRVYIVIKSKLWENYTSQGDNVGVALENVGASRIPHGEGTRCTLLVLQMTTVDYKLDHQDRSWVNSHSFPPLEKQIKTLLIPSLEQSPGFLADPEASREECFEGVQENLLLKIYSFHLNFQSI